MSKIIESYGPLNPTYVKRIHDTISKAQKDYPRLLVIRFDLRLPDEDLRDSLTDYSPDRMAWSRFKASLNAQIKADIRKRKKQGRRTYPCRVRFIRAREFDGSGTTPHQHVCLLLNRDMYVGPGFYGSKKPEWLNMEQTRGLSRMVFNAWARALKLKDKKYKRLVYIPENCSYALIKSHYSYPKNYYAMIQRVMYLAKTKTKHNEDGWRSFSCSQY